MESDLIVFEPANPISYKQVKKDILTFQVITFIGSGIVIYFSRRMIGLGLIIGAIAILSIIFATLFRRYPTKIIINKKTKIFEASYLDAFGNDKTALINLEKAVTTYRLRNPRNSYSGFEVLVYDNIFNSYIKIDRDSNFSEEQLKEIFEATQWLKNY